VYYYCYSLRPSGDRPLWDPRGERPRWADLLSGLEGQLDLRRRLLPPRSHTSDGYYQLRGVQAEDIARASWLKSSISAYNGSCFELARLVNDRVGVRDTKDKGSGPVLVFTRSEWDAFLTGAKAGEFDSI
jgi:hypothetical protein